MCCVQQSPKSTQSNQFYLHQHHMRSAHPFRFVHLLSPKAPSPTLRSRVVTLAASMASEEDSKFGFSREEMYKAELSGTVDGYDRHVFLCYKTPDSWPSRVESDSLPNLLSSAFKSRKDDITIKTKITIFGAAQDPDFADGDVLIFPDMLKYRGLEDSNVDGFVDDVLVNGKPWASGAQEVLAGSHVFVCAHGSRDKRCGVCGPVLMEKLNEEIALRGLSNNVFVSPCSHIGGHKYAGNLIIYGPDAEGKIAGHWYGYVTPEDVPEILEQHIVKGEAIQRLLRGQMGVYEKESKEKLPNGKEEKKKDKKKDKKQHQESFQVNTEKTNTGCCQGANGVSCCQDVSLKGEEKKVAESGEEHGKLSCWTKKWDQTDVLMAAGVVGAVATVAVAYSFYRRSG